VFGAIATVFAVQGGDVGIFSRGSPLALQPMGAGYLILALVDLLWVLNFISKAHSLALRILDRMGLSPTHRWRSPSAFVAAETEHAATNKANYPLGSSIARSVIGITHAPTACSTASRNSPVGSIAASEVDSEIRRPIVEVVPPMLSSILGVPDAPHMPPPALPSSSSKPNLLRNTFRLTHTLLFQMRARRTT
jgi:hypothetical protein